MGLYLFTTWPSRLMRNCGSKAEPKHVSLALTQALQPWGVAEWPGNGDLCPWGTPTPASQIRAGTQGPRSLQCSERPSPPPRVRM